MDVQMIGKRVKNIRFGEGKIVSSEMIGERELFHVEYISGIHYQFETEFKIIA